MIPCQVNADVLFLSLFDFYFQVVNFAHKKPAKFEIFKPQTPQV